MRPPPLTVFLRSFFLDASWHAERMQGLGFAHALLPALGRAADRTAAVRRHAVAFGTNLFMAPALLGAVARLEREERGAEAARVRDLLAAPLSGAGDLFFWGALRPAALGCAVAALCAGWPRLALILPLALFALPGLVWRWRLWRRGSEAGGELPREVSHVVPPRAWIRALRLGAVLVAGILLGWCLQAGWKRQGMALFDVGLALVVGYHAERRLVSPGVAFLLLVALGVLTRRAIPFALPW